MVVFQPCTVTSPHLGSVAIVTNLSSPSAPPDSTIFLGRSFPSFILPPPHHQPFVVVYLILFVPAPHLLSRRKYLKDVTIHDIIQSIHTKYIKPGSQDTNTGLLKHQSATHYI